MIELNRKDIKSMTIKEISADFKAYKMPSFRAFQVYFWICGGAESFKSMTNIPQALQQRLEEKYYIPSISIARKKVSKDGTIKYLFELSDGGLVESVLMKYSHGYSICISTQAGCKMGCTFCVTGQNGFKRNLSASEMLLQIEAAQKDNGIRISNVVLMGMGEPLDNYDEVMRFLGLVSEPRGLGIGMRHVSLSTCGLVDKIYDLANENLQITLSISLHAPNDTLRSSLMKINNRWNIQSLMDACRYYVTRTNRRISFEYAMIQGVTDTTQCATELAELLGGMLCHVNLIPLNKSGNSELCKSSINKIYSFRNSLEKKGIHATIRRTLGADIEAACGQLKSNR